MRPMPLSFGTPATPVAYHNLADDIEEGGTPASVISDDVTMSEPPGISAGRGNRPTMKADAEPEDIPARNFISTTPDTHEPTTPPSPPPGNDNPDEGETEIEMKSASSSETPPSNDADINTPQSPPTPDSWIDRISNNRRRDGTNDVSKAKEDVETPMCLLLNERRIQPKNDSQRQMVELNMGTPATACPPSSTASAVSRQPCNFFRKYPASNVSSNMSFKSKLDDQNTCLSSKISRPAKKQKQSNQLFLDFGQNSFGKQTVCSVCGMLRVHGLDEDDAEHDKICKEYQEGVICLGWKNERMVEAFGKDDRILEVRPDDAQQHRNKVLEVKAIVDKELGFARRQDEDPSGGIAGSAACYMYISKKRIVGLLLVKRIQRAYELLPSKGAHDENNGNSSSISRSLKPSKALVGVHQIWVHKSHRHRGIASRLVTAARDHLIFGMHVPVELVAFSSPTDEGLRFAKTYIGSDRPLIYDIH
jgi:N-acetyltransferase